MGQLDSTCRASPRPYQEVSELDAGVHLDGARRDVALQVEI
jgi:hypothetical protein